MDDEYPPNYTIENYEVFDRFTFDYLFKRLLADGYDHEEAKDMILYNCALSTIVTQERIDNDYYFEISVDSRTAPDLIDIVIIINHREKYNLNLSDVVNMEDYDELTGKVIGCAIEVHRSLGPGLLESAYEKCLSFELSANNIHHYVQKELPVKYKGINLDCGYRIDLLIEENFSVSLCLCGEKNIFNLL
jgi:hypothetical protein